MSQPAQRNIALIAHVYSGGEWIATDQLMQTVSRIPRFPAIHLIGFRSGARIATGTGYRSVTDEPYEFRFRLFGFARSYCMRMCLTYRSLSRLHAHHPLCLVLATKSWMVVAGLLFAFRYRVPVVYLFHGTETELTGSCWNRSYREWIVRLTERLACSFSRFVVVPSESARGYIQNHGFFSVSPSVYTVPNCLSGYFRSASSATTGRVFHRSRVDDIILYRGSMNPVKQVKELIEGFALFRGKAEYRGRLAILYPTDTADREYLGICRQTAKRLGILKQTEFVPDPSPEMQVSYMRRAQVGVLPSAFELQPLVLLESLAFGLPVIISKAGDMPRILGEVDPGFRPIVPEPRAIAQALEQYRHPSILHRAAFSRRAVRYMTLHHTPSETRLAFLRVLSKEGLSDIKIPVRHSP